MAKSLQGWQGRGHCQGQGPASRIWETTPPSRDAVCCSGSQPPKAADRLLVAWGLAGHWGMSGPCRPRLQEGACACVSLSGHRLPGIGGQERGLQSTRGLGGSLKTDPGHPGRRPRLPGIKGRCPNQTDLPSPRGPEPPTRPRVSCPRQPGVCTGGPWPLGLEAGERGEAG